MDAARSVHAAPQSPFHLPSLPPELLLRIAVSTRDPVAMGNFAMVCTGLAALSREPVFFSAMADAAVDRYCIAVAALDLQDRPAYVYRIACMLGARLQLRHLEKLLACLDGRTHASAGSAADDGAAEDETHIHEKAGFELRRATVAAALSSNREIGFQEEPRQYAAQLMHRFPWQEAASRGMTIGTSNATEWHVAFAVDALTAIWESMSTGLSSNPMHHAAAAACICRSIAPLPVASKLALFKSVIDSGVLARCQHLPTVIFLIRAIDEFANFPETLDVELAEKYYSLVGAVTGLAIARQEPLAQYAELVRMLPKVPWRDNSRAGIDWLINFLQHAGVWMNPTRLKNEIPDGIFSDREFDYLLTSIKGDSVSREGLEQVDPPEASRR